MGTSLPLRKQGRAKTGTHHFPKVMCPRLSSPFFTRPFLISALFSILKDIQQPVDQAFPGEFPDFVVSGGGQPFPEGWVLDQASDLTPEEERMGEGHDERGPVVKSEVPRPGFGTDNRQPAGHGLGRGVRPARPQFGADVDISLGEKPGHPVLRQVEIEIVGDVGFYQRARIAAVGSDQRVEEDEPQTGILRVKGFNGPDNVPDAFAAFVDPAVAEDVERFMRGFIQGGMENARIDAARRPVTEDPVLPLHPPADPLGIPEKQKIFPDDLLLPFVALKDEIEIFRGGPEALEPGQDGILAAKGDVEGVVGQGGKGSRLGLEIQPFRLAPLRMEENEGMTAAGELVAELEIAADAAEDLDVREEGGDLHMRNPVPRLF